MARGSTRTAAANGLLAAAMAAVMVAVVAAVMVAGMAAVMGAAPARAAVPSWPFVADAGPMAYEHPLPDAADAAPGERVDGAPATATTAADEAFLRGRSLFRRAWVVGRPEEGDGRGLGPLFNRLSCIACHPANGRGRLPEGEDERLQSALLRLSRPGRGPHGAPRPDPAYGDQWQDEGVRGVPGEGALRVRWLAVTQPLAGGGSVALQRPVPLLQEPAYGPPAADLRHSLRVGSPVYGLGLLEAVPEASLRALVRAQRAAGVAGRINRVWNPVSRRVEAGRFGWKANVADLPAQVVQAAHGDLGLGSTALPGGNCAPRQRACLTRAADDAAVELDEAAVADLVAYLRALAPPAPRDDSQPAVQRGQALFSQTGCALCHRPALPARRDGQALTLAAYTDLLLHDMGPGLADGRPDFRASGRQWRTPPLWGIGLVPQVNGHSRYLHDGRARDLREAVLWHGGQALRARQRFERLAATDQAALLAFVASR